jgi:hypothetical protein
MWVITSDTLIILGLISEGISALITGRKLLSGYYDRLESRTTFRKQIRNERIEGSLILFFLILGMVLQGIAVLWPYLSYPD